MPLFLFGLYVYNGNMLNLSTMVMVNMMMGKIRAKMDKVNSLYTKVFENFEAVTRIGEYFIRPEK